MAAFGQASALHYSRPNSAQNHPGSGRNENAQHSYRSVFELAKTKHHADLKEVFDIRSGVSTCTMGEALSEKYGNVKVVL